MSRLSRIVTTSIHPINKCNKFIKEALVHSDNGPPNAKEERRHILPKNVKGDDTKVIKIKSKDYKNHNYLLGMAFLVTFRPQYFGMQFMPGEDRDHKRNPAQLSAWLPLRMPEEVRRGSDRQVPSSHPLPDLQEGNAG